MKDLHQERARHAWDAVQAVKELPAADRAEFKRHVRGAPARILRDGLLAALAYMHAKKQSRPLRRAILAHCGGIDGDDLHQWIVPLLDADGWTIRRKTAQTLRYLEWLERCAEGEIADEDD